MDTPFDVTGVDRPRLRMVEVYLRQQNQEPCDEEIRAQRKLGWPWAECRQKALDYRRKLNGGSLPAVGSAIAQAIHWAFDYLAEDHRGKSLDDQKQEVRRKIAGFGATT